MSGAAAAAEHFLELLMSGVINHCVCIVSNELFMTRLPLFFCFSWFSHDFKEETKDHSVVLL